MMKTPVGGVPRELRTLLHDGVATALSDRELLDRFLDQPDPAGELAFATLVARHGPMVMNVCRRMLHNPADVDDAFQATFLVLVRRAGSLRFGASLGPWLYAVAVRVARRARGLGPRRHVIALDAVPADAIPERARAVDRELRLTIDEALARLPYHYRAAIVTCYLEGLTQEEAALRLRWPVGTVRSRLARGRALLKNRLERSGLGAALHAREPLGILTLDRAQSVVGSELVKTMARTAARLAGGQALSATVPVGLAQLVAGASPTMTVSRLTLTGSLLVFAGLAAWGVVALAAPSASGEPRAQAQPEAMLLAVAPMSPTPATVEDTSASTDEGKNSPEPSIPDDLPPVVVALEPKLGARDVDPGLKEIRVTFSKKMKDKSWSWTEGKAYAVPKPDGTIHYERDQRTCVMPVKLEPGKTYVLGVNSERFRGFKDADGRPALPYLLVFHTKTAR